MRFEELKTRARKIGVGLDVVPIKGADEEFQVYRITNDKAGYILEVPDLIEVQATIADLELEQHP